MNKRAWQGLWLSTQHCRQMPIFPPRPAMLCKHGSPAYL